MGDQDYMFLPLFRKVTESDPFSQLLVLQKCGHVVNVEKPKNFNDGMLMFLGAMIKKRPQSCFHRPLLFD